MDGPTRHADGRQSRRNLTIEVGELSRVVERARRGHLPSIVGSKLDCNRHADQRLIQEKSHTSGATIEICCDNLHYLVAVLITSFSVFDPAFQALQRQNHQGERGNHQTYSQTSKSDRDPNCRRHPDAGSSG